MMMNLKTHKTLQIFLVLFVFNIAAFAQKKSTKKLSTTAIQIEVSTIGLDDVVIENSTSQQIEIQLFAKNTNQQHIITLDENNTLKISFKIDTFKDENSVFRKFITTRLKRAYAILKIPKNRAITIDGYNTNITTKSIKNELIIAINKSIIRLNNVTKNTIIQLYAGNIYGALNNGNATIKSNRGKILVNDTVQTNPYKLLRKENRKSLVINSIKGNIFLETQ